MEQQDLQQAQPAWACLFKQYAYIQEAYQFVAELEAADPAHDLNHVIRVANNGYWIAQAEGAVSPWVVVAALLHDCKNLPKSHPDSSKSSQYSAEFATDWLLEHSLSPEALDAIYDAILNHSYSRGVQPKTLEGKVMQDADRLDALGAIGIARCMVVAGQRNAPIYSLNDPFGRHGRSFDDKNFALDHFYQKLFRLPGLMHTATAKKMAEERVKRMKDFLQGLELEISPRS